MNFRLFYIIVVTVISFDGSSGGSNGNERDDGCINVNGSTICDKAYSEKLWKFEKSLNNSFDKITNSTTITTTTTRYNNINLNLIELYKNDFKIENNKNILNDDPNDKRFKYKNDDDILMTDIDDYDKDLLVEPEGFLGNIEINEDTFKNYESNELQKKKPTTKTLPSFFRNLDLTKIQSNSKDIEYDPRQNFLYEKNIITVSALPKQDSSFENIQIDKDEIEYKKLKDKAMLMTTIIKNERKKELQKEESVSNNTKGGSPQSFVKYESSEKIMQRNNLQHKQKFSRTKKGRRVRPIKNSKRKNLNYRENYMELRRKVKEDIKEEMKLNKNLYPSGAGDQLIVNKMRERRAVMPRKERIWDYGVIPYEIDNIFSGHHKAIFKQAMKHWENYTCIKFVEREPKYHINYIYFTIKNCGCCSFVGKRGNGRQAISIGSNCDKFGIVVHELGHVIGFWHEHTRIDRDKYIQINRANILRGQEYNFNVLDPEDVDSLGLPYDYSSIMHYARNTFSRSMYLDTITPIIPKGQHKPEIGQRIRLSQGDIAQANLLYKCAKCGRTFQRPKGKIISPGYIIGGNRFINRSHINNDNDDDDDDMIEYCEWRITATHGESITLKIRELQIFTNDTSGECKDNYLEIRDGYWLKSPLIARICGNKIEKQFASGVQSNSSRMLLTYVNNILPKGFKGFIAEFEVTCGGTFFITEARRIDSPNYPLEYLSDKECIWRITVPVEYEVALKFQTFEIENHDNCIYDYVEIRDGYTTDSELIGVFCGYKLPPTIKSNSNKMYVKFVSDSTVQKVGFSGLFMKEVDECKLGKHNCQHECVNTLGSYECICNAGYELESDGISCGDACGGKIDATLRNKSKLTSPSYPDVYPILKDCVWEIKASDNHNVFLNFSHFDLEGSKYQFKECSYDFITIYSKLKDNRLRRIGIFCGSEIPPLIQSEENILRIEFHSDKSIQHTGFLAEIMTDFDECSVNNGGCQHNCVNTYGSYKCLCRLGYTINENGHNCTETNCKFEITSSYGVVHSPNYPNHYLRNTYCYWHFSTIPGHRIQLSFHDFEIENHQECIYDSVTLYDGKNQNSSTLGIYCGEKQPYTILSSTNEMYMVLRTDAGLQKKGFMATHTTECGGYLRATNETKHFYSHARFGNRPYKKNIYCVWRIQSDIDKSIKLSFVSFSVEYETRCNYDYVEVTEDNNHPMKSLHGKFCGNFKPPKIISYSDMLIVKFETDSSTSLKGFAASYIAVEPPEDQDTDNEDSDSNNNSTPFPGYFKNFDANLYVQNNRQPSRKSL